MKDTTNSDRKKGPREALYVFRIILFEKVKTTEGKLKLCVLVERAIYRGKNHR